MNNRDFDEEIEGILDDEDLNLGHGKRRYILRGLLYKLRDKLDLSVYDPN